MIAYEPCVPRVRLMLAAVLMTASTLGALVVLPYELEREALDRPAASVSTVTAQRQAREMSTDRNAPGSVAGNAEKSGLHRNRGRTPT